MGAPSHQAPGITILQRCLKNSPNQQKRYVYQALTLFLTFITYVMYHMNRRPFPVVKSVLSRNCTEVAPSNETCYSWAPFTGSRHDEFIFGLLDFTFMMSYSVSLFASGYIAEREDLRMFLICGMIMTSVSTSLFGLIRVLHVHYLGIFFLIQFACGIAQSTGLPAITEIIGTWIPKKNSGLVFGIWSFHAFLGNILGSLLSGSFLEYDWSLSFFIPAVILLLTALIIYFVLVPDPRYVGISINEDSLDSNNENMLSLDNNKGDDDNDDKYDNNDVIGNIQPDAVGIDCWTALKMNGVVEYSLCIFFVKFVLYTFFFWLPFIINDLVHNSEEAAFRSSIFDVGSGVGGILAGVIYDFTDTPAVICLVFLVSGVPTLYMLFMSGSTLTNFTICMFLAGCFFGGPFILITTSMAKRTSRDVSSSNTRSIAMLAAIFDGFGSIGASVGPLATGVVEGGTKSWGNVSYLLISCTVLGALMITRQCYYEVLMVKSFIVERKNTGKSDDSETENLLEGNED